MMWFERYNFKEDPYVVRDPFETSLEFIQWDREDLVHKKNLDFFIRDVVGGYRVGLKVYGASGSGKTWLLRYLQKELVRQLGDEVVVLYGKIPRFDPTFWVFYDMVVKGWLDHRSRILETIARTAGDVESAWQEHIGDADLASCLWRLKYKADEKVTISLCEHWLRGTKIPVRDLSQVGATASLDRDYSRYSVLVQLLDLALQAFGTCVLMVDELENAPGSLARALGDALRDLLDSFSERFALACSYTAQAADELLDRGYGEFLFRRLEWHVKLDPITPDNAPGVFRVHHGTYRKPGHEGDQLAPFTEQALRRLLREMEPEKWYPGFIFPNCGVLGRLASEASADTIDETFVETTAFQKREVFPYLGPESRLI